MSAHWVEGWPVCPRCDEDELYPMLCNDEGELTCLACGWSGRPPGPQDKPAEVADQTVEVFSVLLLALILAFGLVLLVEGRFDESWRYIKSLDCGVVAEDGVCR